MTTTPDSVVVPLEPTPEMIEAVKAHLKRCGIFTSAKDDIRGVWAHMIAARPAATPGGEREAITRTLRGRLAGIADLSRGDTDEWLASVADDILTALSRPAPEPQTLALLREAAALFRQYEAHHRAKFSEAGRPEKAEVNADIAGRIEAAIAGQPAAARGGEVTDALKALLEADQALARAVNFCEPTARLDELTVAEGASRAARNQAESVLSALSAKGGS